MITEQEKRRRRITYRFVQLALIVLSVGIVVAFVANRRSPREPEPTFRTDAPTLSELGPGDTQLFNIDTTVQLVLRGDKMLAGLSPKMVDKVRSGIKGAGPKDADGIGGVIAAAVKEQVADKIDTHVEYDIRDIEDIRYEDSRIIIEWKSGKEEEVFGSFKKDGKRGEANSFRREEALRFIELVKARQQQISR